MCHRKSIRKYSHAFLSLVQKFIGGAEKSRVHAKFELQADGRADCWREKFACTWGGKHIGIPNPVSPLGRVSTWSRTEVTGQGSSIRKSLRGDEICVRWGDMRVDASWSSN